MDTLSDSAARVLDIEARQDDALRQVEELERRVEQVLAEHLPALAKMASHSASGELAARAISPPAIKAA
jgi:hypothetical protein